MIEKYVYYGELQHLARQHIASKANHMDATYDTVGFPGVTLSSISDAALIEADEEWPKYHHISPHGGFGNRFRWAEVFRKFQYRPSSFNLAVWQKLDSGTTVLQALAIGRPSRGKSHLTIHALEKCFAPYELKHVSLLVLSCASEYAKLLGASRVLIKEALHESVYLQHGFKQYQLPRLNRTFLSRDVS